MNHKGPKSTVVDFAMNADQAIFGTVKISEIRPGKFVKPVHLFITKSNHRKTPLSIESLRVTLDPELIAAFRSAINSNVPGQSSRFDVNSQTYIYCNKVDQLIVEERRNMMVVSNELSSDKEELLKMVDHMEYVYKKLTNPEFLIGSEWDEKPEVFGAKRDTIIFLGNSAPLRFSQLKYIVVEDYLPNAVDKRIMIVHGQDKFTFNVVSKDHESYERCLDKIHKFLEGIGFAKRGMWKAGAHYISNTPPIKFVSWEPSVKQAFDQDYTFWLSLLDQQYNQYVSLRIDEYHMALLTETIYNQVSKLK